MGRRQGQDYGGEMMEIRHRAMIEQTLFNLAYDMEYINHSEDMRQELHRMTDAELITVFNGFIEEMEV